MLITIVSLHTPSIQSFETNQSVDFSWFFDMNDIDQLCNCSFERYSLHQLIHAEVYKSHVYIARGSGDGLKFYAYQAMMVVLFGIFLLRSIGTEKKLSLSVIP